MAVRPIWKFAGILAAVGGVAWVGASKFGGTSKGKQVQATLQSKAAVASAGRVKDVDGNPAINVCVVTWGGYAGGEYFNGGFKFDKGKSRYWKEYNLPVNFLKIDEFAPSRDAWKSDECQVIWTTIDAFPTEAGALAENAPQVFFLADKSRGGDVIVGTREIRSMKDLCRPTGQKRKVALLKGSPSHTMLLKSLEAQGCSERDVEVVSATSAPNAAEIFKNGEAQAAVVWSPDDADCLANVPGSHVLASTKQATDIIADVFFAKKAYIEANEDRLAKLVEGWLRGAAEINASAQARKEAARVLADGLGVQEDWALMSIGNARLATYGDNVSFFNLKGGFTGVTAKYVYEDMGRKYRDVGMVEGTLPKFGDVVNLSVLRKVNLSGPEHVAEGTRAFSRPDETVAKAEAFASKPVTIEFPSGSSALTEEAKIALDEKVMGTIKGFAGARIRVIGNTDDVGADDSNQRLSERRARAVVEYIVRKYGYDPNRFYSEGRGEGNPVADNATSEGRQRNRRTDVEVVTAQ